MKYWKSTLTLKITGVSEGKCGMGQIRKDVNDRKMINELGLERQVEYECSIGRKLSQ